mgnify:CR=1 FL=1
MDPQRITAAARQSGYTIVEPAGAKVMARSGGTGMPNPELVADDKILGIDKKTAMIGGAAVLALAALLLLRK